MTNREKILQEGQEQIDTVIDEYLEYCDKLNQEFIRLCNESRERLKCLN